ncbi:hypothetical protein DRW07_10230 [Alteromonas sediminis]|uniref:NADH:ubiquinone oxidoreductase intermediate-associated protein 30 domain-containing protein n=1 Tax=Alteromonas sediminis TaxID=2259342 RepID=A0A3N5Y0P5_9ALTE|nr:CIA30 family protein [Alteromonas sediminis]RPJ66463.1 hypothetical protein DRW07_10230 [Alteromonas sediminis]
MNTLSVKKRVVTVLAATALICLSNAGLANELSKNIDNFSDATNNNLGLARIFMNDSTTGGKTTTSSSVSNGIMTVTGKIAPARGQPGWASTVLLLDPAGQPKDASHYEGIKLVIKINKGNVNVSANSTKVSNYDYHVAPVVVTQYGEFQEVSIPFNSMKRAWSAQTELDTQTLSSISIVAWDMQANDFDFAIDQVSFY